MISTSKLLAHLNLTTLRLFVAVCEERTLTRAAVREAIAPSAVSKRVAELEFALGVTLFHRETKGMVPTPAGETLLHHARRMLLDAEQIAIEMEDHGQGTRGFIRMLANLSAIVEFLPEDLQSFLAGHAAVKIDLEERPSTGVVAGVRDGLAEIGVCSGDVEADGLRCLPYRTDRLVVVMGADHALATQEDVAFAETLDHDHIGLHAASSIYTRSLIAARLAGKPLRLRIHVPGFDAVCRMAQAGMGVGIIPDRAYDILGRPMGLVARPLTDAWGVRALRIVLREQPVSRLGALLVDHLRSRGAA